MVMSFGSVNSTLLVARTTKYVCFTFAKYVNDTMPLCETTNVFIDAFCKSKIPFYWSRPLKLIKTMLKSLTVL